MAEIIIVGGTYPNQKSQLILSNLILKNSSNETVRYCLRLAISSIEKTSEGREDLTFKLTLKDNSVVIATATYKTFQDIQKASVTPMQPGDTPWAIYTKTDEKKISKDFIGGIIVICVVLFIGFSLMGSDDGPKKPKPVRQADINDARIMTAVFCKDRVKETLRAPRTAKFPFVTDATFDGRTAVQTSYVDAENGFGAMIRTHYVCTLEYNGGDAQGYDSWKIKDFVVLQ